MDVFLSRDDNRWKPCRVNSEKLCLEGGLVWGPTLHVIGTISDYSSPTGVCDRKETKSDFLIICGGHALSIETQERV